MYKDFLIETYINEFERKDAIESSCANFISFTLALIAIEITFVKFLLNTMSWNHSKVAIIGLLILTFVIQFISIFHAIICYHKPVEGYEYEYLPVIGDIKELRKHLSIIEFENEIFWAIERSIANNQKINDDRSEYLHISKTTMIFSIIIIVISSFVFLSSN